MKDGNREKNKPYLGTAIQILTLSVEDAQGKSYLGKET